MNKLSKYVLISTLAVTTVVGATYFINKDESDLVLEPSKNETQQVIENPTEKEIGSNTDSKTTETSENETGNNNQQGFEDGGYVRTLRYDEIEQLVSIESSIHNLEKSTEKEIYTTITGENITIYLNPTRADYYSNKFTQDSLEKCVEFVHALMTYQGENNVYFLKRLTSFFNGGINNQMMGWINHGSLDSENVLPLENEVSFPVQEYKAITNVKERSLVSIDIRESDDFAEPFLDFEATAVTKFVSKTGEQGEEKYQFRFTFDKNEEKYKRIKYILIKKI